MWSSGLSLHWPRVSRWDGLFRRADQTVRSCGGGCCCFNMAGGAVPAHAAVSMRVHTLLHAPASEQVDEVCRRLLSPGKHTDGPSVLTLRESRAKPGNQRVKLPLNPRQGSLVWPVGLERAREPKLAELARLPELPDPIGSFPSSVPGFYFGAVTRC